MLSFYCTLIDAEEDKIAFEHIYNTYRKRMFYIANTILKNKEDAEDAVQNALLGIAKTMTEIASVLWFQGVGTAVSTSHYCASRRRNNIRRPLQAHGETAVYFLSQTEMPAQRSNPLGRLFVRVERERWLLQNVTN